MTDRELLELAAKAAGYPPEWKGQVKVMCDAPIYEREWNPLTDDGDALRLAVKLTIVLENGDGCLTAKYASDLFEFRDHGDDALAATRHAIVTVAARMSKELL